MTSVPQPARPARTTTSDTARGPPYGTPATIAQPVRRELRWRTAGRPRPAPRWHRRPVAYHGNGDQDGTGARPRRGPSRAVSAGGRSAARQRRADEARRQGRSGHLERRRVRGEQQATPRGAGSHPAHRRTTAATARTPAPPPATPPRVGPRRREVRAWSGQPGESSGYSTSRRCTTASEPTATGGQPTSGGGGGRRATPAPPPPPPTPAGRPVRPAGRTRRSSGGDAGAGDEVAEQVLEPLAPQEPAADEQVGERDERR